MIGRWGREYLKNLRRRPPIVRPMSDGEYDELMKVLKASVDRARAAQRERRELK